MNLKSINKETLLFVFSFLVGVSLPFKDQFSTVALVIFTTYYLIISFINGSKLSYNIIFLLPSLLLLPRLLGYFTGEPGLALKELLRSLPLLILFVPFFLFKYSQKVFINKLERYFLFGILIGLVLFMIYCNFTVVSEMVTKNEPIEYLFRWRHMNINFVKPVETHPPYVGILAVYALIKTLYDKVFKTYLKVIITILILFLLVQLLARNALIVSIAVLVYTAIKELNYRVMLVVVILSVALGLLIVNHPHPYLKKKLLDRLNFTEKKKFDKRLDRTKASYFVFKTSPIIGVGPGNDNRLRKEQYKALGFYNAFKYNFNSHNQFMEYLVSSGLVGLILFLCVLYFLWCFSKGANDSSKLLIIAFIFSCLTESVLERSLGIKYFALISFFILLRFSGDEQKLSQ